MKCTRTVPACYSRANNPATCSCPPVDRRSLEDQIADLRKRVVALERATKTPPAVVRP